MDSINRSDFILQATQFCRALHELSAPNKQKIEELEETADGLLNSLLAVKDEVLGSINEKLRLEAEDYFIEMIREGNILRRELHKSLVNYSNMSASDWNELVKTWSKYLNRWNNTQILIEKIVQAVSYRASTLIDKDLKVIHDYKHQSLQKFSGDPEAFENMEKRLTQTTQEAMKMLNELKKMPVDISQDKISEWIDSLHAKRQAGFENVLLKIDSVMKGTVREAKEENPEIVFELRGELTFIEFELKHIEEQKSRGEVDDALKAQIADLFEHFNEIFKDHIPMELEGQYSVIKRRIEALM